MLDCAIWADDGRASVRGLRAGLQGLLSALASRLANRRSTCLHCRRRRRRCAAACVRRRSAAPCRMKTIPRSVMLPRCSAIDGQVVVREGDPPFELLPVGPAVAAGERRARRPELFDEGDTRVRIRDGRPCGVLRVGQDPARRAVAPELIREVAVFRVRRAAGTPCRPRRARARARSPASGLSRMRRRLSSSRRPSRWSRWAAA